MHQLLNNPHAKARYSVKLNYKPFNFIIMTSAFIIGLSALLIWSNPKKANVGETSSSNKSGVVTEVVVDSNFSSKRTSDLKKPGVNNLNITTRVTPKSEAIREVTKDSTLPQELAIDLIQTNVENQTFKTEVVKNDNSNQVQSVTPYDPKVYSTLPEYMTESCAWSPDTIIDKKLLLLELSDKELKPIGIAKKGLSTFYHNIIEGQYDMCLTSHPDLIPAEERITTFNKFYVAYTTNSHFEPVGSWQFLFLYGYSNSSCNK